MFTKFKKPFLAASSTVGTILAVSACASFGQSWQANPTSSALPVLAEPAGGATGHCPEGEYQKNYRTSGETEYIAVTENELASIDLSNEVVQLTGRHMRLRQLSVEPGGQVAWHSHAERPALIITVAGTIKEFRSDCKVAIEHGPGSVSKEAEGISHWWRNDGDEPVTLIAADIMPPA